MIIKRQEDVTAAVLEAFENTADPRLREILTALVKHLHAFARDVRLTEEEFQKARHHYAHGLGGLLMVGDPDRIAQQLADLSRAGLRGIGFSFVNYLKEMPYFCAEVLPRLERMGIRQPRKG